MPRPRRTSHFQIVITPRARVQLLAIINYIAHHAPANAERFGGRLLDAIDGLATFPTLHPFAPERRRTRRNIRQVLVHPYRVIFEIEGDQVVVYTIRHAAQRSLRRLT